VQPYAGGALEVYRCTKERPGGSGKEGPGGKGKGKGCKEYSVEKRAARRAEAGYDVQFDPATMQTVASVPYETNTLVMFINSPRSYHG
jgi:hypothetical protein